MSLELTLNHSNVEESLPGIINITYLRDVYTHLPNPLMGWVHTPVSI